jgi:XTP/dITP diphosphohydrolase
LTPVLPKGGRLVLATHNQGKLAEFAGLVAPYGLSVISAAALGASEPEETGATFEENALIKALAVAKASGLPALADDSGLAVEALGGAPGVHSARWAGPAKDFRAAMQSIEEKLAALGATAPDQRRAAFVAVLALALPDGSNESFRGEVQGTLTWPPRGDNGFGYDPVFIPEGETRTFGEMSREEKQILSHRARAFRKFAGAKLR